MKVDRAPTYLIFKPMSIVSRRFYAVSAAGSSDAGSAHGGRLSMAEVDHTSFRLIGL